MLGRAPRAALLRFPGCAPSGCRSPLHGFRRVQGEVYRVWMDHEAEQAALTEVRRRLAERHPDQDESVVAKAVHEAHAKLTGPIRDFVGVLVEHAAHDELRALDRQRAAEGAPPSW